MIDHAHAGLLPAKPHTVFRAPDGALLHEEMLTRGGFDGPFAYLYHRHPVTPARRVVEAPGFAAPERAAAGMFPNQRRLYDANALWDRLASAGGAASATREAVLFNDDVVLSVVAPSEPDPTYFANNDGDDLHYVVSGRGRLESSFGWLDLEAGDYLHVPRSVIHRLHPGPGLRLFTIEGRRDVIVPSSFRNPVGQLTMNAPYTERDFVRPAAPIADLDALPDGPRDVLVKRLDRFTMLELERCPMDVVGWDGYLYPFTFAMKKYQPRTGQLHLPPTVHTTFVGASYVVCSFVPRAVDFHPDAIPCPYPHSSVDCDEVLLYLAGNFTSRRGVGPGCVSLHPAGLPHGPHPGAYEASIGARWTDESAVMLDTFKPLWPTAAAVGVERAGYQASWSSAAGG